MGNQTINIENNTGTVNVFGTEEKKDKNKETISIAAIDKYSSPLKAHVEMSRWGKKMHRVSFLVENSLLGQVVQQNYLTYKDQKEARDVFDSIIEMMYDFKERTEEELIHSAILLPKIWKEMATYKDDLHKPESDDLSYRFHNQEAIENVSEMPPGLLIHPINEHFPGHGGIVEASSFGLKKFASKQNEIQRIRIIDSYNQEKRLAYFNGFLTEWNDKKFNFVKFATLMTPLQHEREPIRNIKRKSVLKIRPLFYEENKRKWAIANENEIDEAISMMGEYAVDPSLNGKEIDIGKYDLFIFDADRTIWEGDVPARAMEEPFQYDDRDTIIDAKGQRISLMEGIRDILVGLRAIGKDVGLISKSEKEGIDYQDQPVIKLLRTFGLLDVFNEMIVIERDIPKSVFIPSGERVLFIDDEVDNLSDVKEHSDADAIEAEDFLNHPFEEEEEWINEDIEPIDVIELKEGETEEDLKNWLGREDEIFFPIEKNVYVRARVRVATPLNWKKVSKKKENVEYIECPKDCGSPSGSMGAHFGIEKEDKKLWLPVSRKKEYDKTCKEIKEDLKEPMSKVDEPATKRSDSGDWYKESKRDYIPVSERPEKPKDGKDYELDHRVPKNKKGLDSKDNLQWIEKNKHKEKSKNEGSFIDGGDKKVKHEKSKGKEKYKSYQKSCGESKQKKDREELGEAGYSKQQSEIAKKRWRS